jgi:hypothetical protein
MDSDQAVASQQSMQGYGRTMEQRPGHLLAEIKGQDICWQETTQPGAGHHPAASSAWMLQ